MLLITEIPNFAVYTLGVFPAIKFSLLKIGAFDFPAKNCPKKLNLSLSVSYNSKKAVYNLKIRPILA
jgi:hypothetical protein